MTYVPGLDGLRAVAVIAVLLFHAEFTAASGGFLGVSLFFTLSGFLITTLLLAEYDATGTLYFRRFYARRARRLLPAAYACLALVVAGSAWWAADQQRDLPGDVLASVANVANWRFAFSTTSYQELFLGEPSPVAHFWSLAIEEQIYLVLPLVVYAALRRGRRTLAVVTGALLVASMSATLLTSDTDLVYNGTHTRAAELLVGVALAQVLRHRTFSPAAVVGAHRSLPGVLAAAAFVASVATASIEQAWIYDGGLFGVALVSAVLITTAVDGRFPASLLAARPLVAIGKVSYGIYLFHWPVFLLLDEQRTGLEQIPLFLVRCAVTAALAVASYVVIEQPVRRGKVTGDDRMMVPAMFAAAAAVVVAAVLVVPTPTLSETEQLLAVGEQGVVEFAEAPTIAVEPPSVAAGANRVESSADSPVIPELVGDGPIEGSTPTALRTLPARVAVLGSEPVAVTALRDADRGDGFDVVDGVRVDCPLSSAAAPGCGRLVDRWNAIAADGPVDVVVLVTNAAEGADVRARTVAAVTGDEMAAVGVDEEEAIDEVLATIDAAIEQDTEVVWYTPALPSSAYFGSFSRIGVERPGARTVVGDSAQLAESVREVVTVRTAGDRGAASQSPALNVLVIGDSTSLNFARALHDGSDGQLVVLWAGANGCPFATVEATRPRSGEPWTEASCEPWSSKVPPLADSFDPDVLLVMTGPMELTEHRYAGDSAGWVADDARFAEAREVQLVDLLTEVDADLPVLIADLPVISAGLFSVSEMTAPERLAAVNAQIVEWDQRFAQVARFPYRDTLEAAEAARAPGDPIRSDGTHPDVEPLAALAREVYVDRLIEITAAVRAELSTATVVDR